MVRGGLDGLQNRIIAAQDAGLKVKVGLPRGSGTHGPSGMPVVELGAIHEFGTERVPERSFLRSTIREKRREHNDMIRRLGRNVIRGTETIERALGIVGTVVAANVQETIADGVPPPNAPSTIARKGSSTPLIDTGALRQSITHQVFRDRR